MTSFTPFKPRRTSFLSKAVQKDKERFAQLRSVESVTLRGPTHQYERLPPACLSGGFATAELHQHLGRDLRSYNALEAMRSVFKNVIDEP